MYICTSFCLCLSLSPLALKFAISLLQTWVLCKNWLIHCQFTAIALQGIEPTTRGFLPIWLCDDPAITGPLQGIEPTTCGFLPIWFCGDPAITGPLQGIEPMTHWVLSVCLYQWPSSIHILIKTQSEPSRELNPWHTEFCLYVCTNGPVV